MTSKIVAREVQGGTSKGGYEYNELITPATEVYEFKNLKKYEIYKDCYWHGYIKGSEIKKKKFPLDANPRKPSPTRVVRLMQSTIQKESAHFHHLNNGITIIASRVEYDERTRTAKIHFGKPHDGHGDGVCNGGHSYFSIEQFKGEIPDNMLVRVEIIELDPSLSVEARAEKVKKIAEARNAHNELESITTAHYSGYYDSFIKYLGSDGRYIKWFEGDPNAIKGAESVDSFIAKITAICPLWYSHYLNQDGNTGNHITSARNQGAVHKKWVTAATQESDDRNMHFMIPLLKDVLFLMDEINFSLRNDDFSSVKKVWKKTRIWKYLSEKKNLKKLHFKHLKGKSVESYDLSHTFITMVLGSFRENVWYSVSDEGINYVGWLKDPFDLWNSHKVKLFGKLDQIASSISAPSFGNAFLQNPAIYGYQLTEFEFGAKIEDYLDKPDVIYDVHSGNKYVKSKASDATHFFKIEFLEGVNVPVVSMAEEAAEGLIGYKNVDLR